MQTAESKIKLPKYSYNPELDKIKTEDYFPGKLEKAKAYFREHGVPDFNKIIKEAEEKKKQVNSL